MITTVPNQPSNQLRFTDTEGDTLLVDPVFEGVVLTTITADGDFSAVLLDESDVAALLAHLLKG